MGLVTPEKTQEFAEKHFPRFGTDELKALNQVYTPQQVKAVEAGEAAIEPEDLAIQGRWRTDAYRMPYFEDFAEYKPSIDKFPKETEPSRPDPMARWMTQEQFELDWAKFLEERLPQKTRDAVRNNKMNLEMAAIMGADPSEEDFWEFVNNRSKLAGGYQPERIGRSKLAPALPDKVPGVAGLYDLPDKLGLEQVEDSDTVKSDTLSPETLAQEKRGWSEKMLENVALRLVEARRVTNQTRLGKVYSVRYTVIAGNGDGWIGMGMAKGGDDTVTPLKAKALAILNMKPIRRYEDRTIYGNVKAKVGGTQVELYARPPGFGLRVPNNIFHICRFAGIKDLAAKMPRAANKMNTVKAMLEALHGQKDPEVIARGRGKKLVDVRKVYYGGLVY